MEMNEKELKIKESILKLLENEDFSEYPKQEKKILRFVKKKM